MQAHEAQHTLENIDRLRSDTRKALHPTWFTNILWGVLVLIGGPIADAFGAVVAVYWLIAVPIGMFLTIRFFRNRAQERGIRENPLPWILLSAALIIGAFGTGAFFLGKPEGVMPMLAASAGVIGFGLLARHMPMVVVGVLGVLTAVAVAVIVPPLPNIIMAAVLGGGMLLLGLHDRPQDRRESVIS